MATVQETLKLAQDAIHALVLHIDPTEAENLSAMQLAEKADEQITRTLMDLRSIEKAITGRRS
jgi:hypothetical protein